MALAIEAFAKVKQGGLVPSSVATELRLVVGGGFDDQQPDNVRTLAALRSLCDQYGLAYDVLTSASVHPPPSDVDVVFILNFSTAQRSALLLAPNTLALLYTPQNEHFGIVPIEAMACGLPVVACNRGGPTETVVDFDSGDSTATGYLRGPNASEWAPALAALVNLSDEDRKRVSTVAKKRVRDQFSSATLGRELEEACRDAKGSPDPQTNIGDKLIRGSLTLLAAGAAFFAFMIYIGQPKTE